MSGLAGAACPFAGDSGGTVRRWGLAVDGTEAAGEADLPLVCAEPPVCKFSTELDERSCDDRLIALTCLCACRRQA